MIRVIKDLELDVVISDVLYVDENSQNLLKEKTPRPYYELKEWLSDELANFLVQFELDVKEKTNATYGDNEETSPHLKKLWKSALKDMWKDDDCLRGLELPDNAKPSFAWLAMFFQMGFKSTLTFAPSVNTRMGDLDAIFDQGDDKQSIADVIKNGGDKHINVRQVSIFPYTVSSQDTPATDGIYSSRKLRSTCCAPALVDVQNRGGGLWESKKAEVEFSSKHSCAFPITYEEVNRTLLLLNNYKYITNSPNLDYKKAWEFIFKKRDISTIQALKFLIMKLNLPPTILVQNTAQTEERANIGKSQV
jgi:hypothetical protein